MPEGKEGFKYWVPKEGQIITLKHGVVASHEFRHVRRLSEEAGSPLEIKEGKLYEIIEYKKSEYQKPLRVRNVHVKYLIGKRLVSLGKEVEHSLDVDFFELAKEDEE